MTKHTNSNVAELLRRVEFSVARKGSNFYFKSMLPLHSNTLRCTDMCQVGQLPHIHAIRAGREHNKHTERDVENMC